MSAGPLTVERLRRRRKLMFWISLPVVLFTLFWGFKFVSLAPTAQLAIDAYDDGRYVVSELHSTSLLSVNVVEPYLPYFNRGDAYAGEEYYGPATDDFEIALELAPLEKKCDVRLNLALTWERFGDIYAENGFYQGSILLYEASTAVLEAAGEECDPPENQEQLDEAKDRVEQKQQQTEEQRDATQPPPDESDGQTEQEKQLDELEEQQQQAAQEKADEQSQDRGQESGGGYTNRPW